MSIATNLCATFAFGDPYVGSNRSRITIWSLVFCICWAPILGLLYLIAEAD